MTIRVPRPSWQRDAACRDTAERSQVAVFFPAGNRSMQPAKTICAGCPVRTECLEYAIADATLVGVWGGTSETERDHIRYRRRIA